MYIFRLNKRSVCPFETKQLVKERTHHHKPTVMKKIILLLLGTSLLLQCKTDTKKMAYKLQSRQARKTLLINGVRWR